nr:hypothetical protein [Candidatus Woesebacteria bacterium]
MAIQTQWSYSLDTEVRRIYVTFVKIVSTYFRQRDIPIAYPPVTKKLRNTVIIPRLDLQEMRRMRTQFSRVDDPYRFETPSDEVRLHIRELYERLHDEEFPKNHIVELWSKHNTRILKAINSVIPHVLDPIQNIHI